MATNQAAQSAVGPALIEAHSIDYVPWSERHGKAWHVGPIWFTAIAELATLTVGLIGISVGGSFWWMFLAIVLGVLIGTLFMAFHSAQGPRMGLPQMIQSRAQFGYYGAALPQALTLFLYVGFTVFNVVIGAEALSLALGVGTTPAILIVLSAAVVLATVGYKWIHIASRWGAYVFLVVFGILTITVLLTTPLPSDQWEPGSFDLVPFLVMFGVAAGYQLSIAPYVSDYSRYLPHDVSSRSVFWPTYLGAVVAAVWMMGLGAYLMAAEPDVGAIESVQAGGDHLFEGFGTIALLVGLLGMVTVSAFNIYGGTLVAIGLVDTVRRVKPTVGVRLAWVAVITLIAGVIALNVTEDFLAAYNNFLLIILYTLTPWTAINLVDFYFVRKGEYAIREIFNPSGIYHRWGRAGLVAYVVSFLAMIPFFSTDFYTGPVANQLEGADIAPFIGLPVAAIVYLVMTRDLDMSQERAVAERDQMELEG